MFSDAQIALFKQWQILEAQRLADLGDQAQDAVLTAEETALGLSANDLEALETATAVIPSGDGSAGPAFYGSNLG